MKKTALCTALLFTLISPSPTAEASNLATLSFPLGGAITLCAGVGTLVSHFFARKNRTQLALLTKYSKTLEALKEKEKNGAPLTVEELRQKQKLANWLYETLSSDDEFGQVNLADKQSMLRSGREKFDKLTIGLGIGTVVGILMMFYGGHSYFSFLDERKERAKLEQKRKEREEIEYDTWLEEPSRRKLEFEEQPAKRTTRSYKREKRKKLPKEKSWSEMFDETKKNFHNMSFDEISEHHRKMSKQFDKERKKRRQKFKNRRKKFRKKFDNFFD